MDNVTIVFQKEDGSLRVDLDVPLDISAADLIEAVNTAYGLGMDIGEVKRAYLVSENPIARLTGNKTLREYGIRQGSIVIYKED